MHLTKEEFIKHTVLPRSQARNFAEEQSKRALSEQLAKEVAEFEKRKKITRLPVGFSYEMKVSFTSSNSEEGKQKTKKLRMQNQQELLIQYAGHVDADWVALSHAIGGISPSQLRRAYQGKAEIVSAWGRVRKHIESVLAGRTSCKTTI